MVLVLAFGTPTVVNIMKTNSGQIDARASLLAIFPSPCGRPQPPINLLLTRREFRLDIVGELRSSLPIRLDRGKSCLRT